MYACDGSDINVPKDKNNIDSYIQYADIDGFNQVHLNTMYDVLNRKFVDAVIQSEYRKDEIDAAIGMIHNIHEAKSVLGIFDRGYE